MEAVPPGDHPMRGWPGGSVAMDQRALRAEALLLLAALIWGLAFVAQRLGMAHLGPFAFNGLRFALGCLVLLPPVILRRRRRASRTARSGDPPSGETEARPLPPHGRLIAGSDPCPTASTPAARASSAAALAPAAPMSVRPPAMASSAGAPAAGWLFRGGLLLGLVLFAGASLQQAGMVFTTAGKAGFITGLYVVLVPAIGHFLGERSGARLWAGALLAAGGLYLLSVTGRLSMNPGDLLVLLSAFVWAVHVLLVGRLVRRIDPLELALAQFALCALLSLAVALVFEEIEAAAIGRAALPLLYAGLLSVGVAYTLQLVAQRHARPARAAILLSLETVFAALGGWLVLGEILGGRGFLGSALMLAGMIVSQTGRGEMLTSAPEQPRTGSGFPRASVRRAARSNRSWRLR